MALPLQPLSRRGLVRLGAFGWLGLDRLLARSNTLRAADGVSIPPKADHAILLFLNGGPSHLDTWDMKPDAPAEIRGPFSGIPTSVPGVRFGEHLPLLARQMHRLTVIRSMHHSVNNSHAAAVYCALTGQDRGEFGGGARPTDHPAMGSIAAQLRPPRTLVPGYVSLPYITQEGAGGPPQPGFAGGIAGRGGDPLYVLRDPSAPGFRFTEFDPADGVDGLRLADRRGLLGNIDIPGGDDPSLAPFRDRAFRLLVSPASRQAFELEREPAKLRDAYGRNIYGQSTLLARRLVEAGTRLVCLSWAPHANATWDTHGNNFKALSGSLLPQLDAAAATLLEDLESRGLLDRTLVLIGGEFGRSPKVNKDAGRDHWNFCYSFVAAGGGFKRGYVHGASDKIGRHPSLSPLTPADLVATAYQCLGISHEQELRDRLDRPYFVCPWGKPVPDLLS